MSALIKRHPVLTYYALVFAISWVAIGLLFAVTSGGSGFLLAILVMVAGPGVASIVLTHIVDGREGVRRLLFRLCQWRVNVRWYCAALLITPLMLAGLLFALGRLVSPIFWSSVDSITSTLALGVVYGLFAGFFEEIGWTGYAVPKVQLTHSALFAGLMVGVIWGIWHFLADFLSLAASYGALYIPHIILWIVTLTAYRVLIVWVYTTLEVF